jgi:ribulose-phosphate 3-epimerase
MVEIIPAILSTTAADYHKKFKAVEPFTEWIQVDIVDGRFAPNKTIGPEAIKPFLTSKKLEIHLMVKFIEDWVDRFIKIVAVKRIIFPIETAVEPIKLISHLHHHNVEAGAALNPDTPAERLRHIIGYLDTVLLLSVYPGFQGQHFVHNVLKKIMGVREMRPDIKIEVDGAIVPGTARHCAEMGANILAAGSFIFKNDKMSTVGRRFTSTESGYKIEGSTYQERIKNALEALRADVEGVVPVLE